jgi:hypothetical protein
MITLKGREAEYAKALATALMAELSPGDHHISPSNKAKLAEKIYDRVPSRQELNFFIEQGEPAAKRHMEVELSSQDEQELFCMSHCEFVPKSGVDIEHAFSHSGIRANQTAFIKLLNDHPDFATQFLTQAEMGTLFKRGDSHRIKATGYFYKLCYNALGNLWLLCHACNIKKSDSASLDWFSAQPMFGRAFVDAVHEQGDLQNGIIIDRIYQLTDEDLLLDTQDEEGNVRCLFIRPTNAPALGEFVRDWFSKTHAGLRAAHKAFYDKEFAAFKQEIDEVEALLLETDPDKHAAMPKLYRKLKTRREQGLIWHQATKAAAEELSDSSNSPGSLTEENQAHDTAYSARQIKDRQHQTKKITDFLDRNFNSANKRLLWNTIPEAKKTLGEPKKWRHLSEQLKAQPQPITSANTKTLLDTFAQSILTKDESEQLKKEQAEQVRAADQRTEEEARGRKEAEQRAEEETRGRKEAEQRAEEETRGRKEAEREVAELKAQLAARDATDAATTQQSASFFGASAANTTGPEPALAKKRKVDKRQPPPTDNAPST